MNATFYVLSDDDRKINKNLNVLSITLDLNIRADIDFINPRLLITRENFNQGFNYVYIEDWKAYYFITSITYMAKGVYDIRLHIDVLMTFRDTILSSEVLTSQSANLELYFNGGDWNSLVTKEVDTYESTVNLSADKSTILVAVGSVQ